MKRPPWLPGHVICVKCSAGMHKIHHKHKPLLSTVFNTVEVYEWAWLARFRASRRIFFHFLNLP